LLAGHAAVFSAMASFPVGPLTCLEGLEQP
jgi:hypothetical protein